MRAYEEARWLLQQYLSELATEFSHDGKLDVLCSESAGRDFLAKQVWIIITLSEPSSAAKVSRVRAFNEIVGRLRQSVDFQWREFYQSFWRDALMKPLVCSICNKWRNVPETTELDDFDQLMESEGPRFVLNFSHLKHGRHLLEMLHDLLLTDSTQALGESHSFVLARLAPGVRSIRASKKARIELGLLLPTLRTSEFHALAQLLEDVAEQEGHILDSGVRYEITTLRFPCVNKSLGDMEVTILERMIASETSTTRRLQMENTLSVLKSAQSLQLFAQLLRTTVCRSLGDTTPILTALQLHNTPFDHPYVASICLVLQYSNSLNKLHLDWSIPSVRDDARAKLIWAWIAYGIFHPDSEAKLNRLNLSGPPLFKPEDTATFAPVIQHTHPGKQLWGLEHGDLPEVNGLEEVALPAGRRVFAQLKAKTKLRMAPKRKPKSFDFLRPTRRIWVRSASVVSRSKVVSKCRPESQVVARDGTVRSEDAPPLAGANVTVFDRFTLAEEDQDEVDQLPEGEHAPIDPHHGRYGPDPIEQITFLLRMIGHSLDGLNYAAYDLRISDSDLSDILDACPNLKHLASTDGRIASLTPLADQYQAQQCRILPLSIATEYGGARLLSQLAELLESPYATPLRFVAVNGRVKAIECFEKLGSALNTNQSLQTDFEAVPQRPRLSRSSAIAFLSVTESHARREHSTASGTSDCSSPSLGKLDSSIVSQVFAFARIPIKRVMV